MGMDLAAVMPFEVCSIRPPTENYSLTFRLTRNCYWKKCCFCPAYKFGTRFSKRGLEEVREDVKRAGVIDQLLTEHGMGAGAGRCGDYGRVNGLVRDIEEARRARGLAVEEEPEEKPEDMDPRLAWFLSWFKDKPHLEDSIHHVLAWRTGGGATCFLGDADSLILRPEFIQSVIGHVKRQFPSLRRFTVYGRTKTAARVRSLEELRKFSGAGLDRVHFGIESGSDRVLHFMRKGVTREEHIEGGLRTREAGLSCSVYVMPGLGGEKWWEEHALDTADVLSRISPDYVRLRTLQIFPRTPLDEACRKGEFVEADDELIVREIRTMIEAIDTDTEILSDSASNLLALNGRLPEDRGAMLEGIDGYLSLSNREKLVFSLQSRLRSFMGQYGGLSRDISNALGPYMKNGRFDPDRVPDRDALEITGMVKSRLMP